MSTGKHGHGTTLTGSTSGTVGNVLRVGIGGRTRDMIDISTMDSTDKFREFMAGMADAGELTIEMNFDDGAIATALNSAWENATSETWTVNLGIKTWVGTGIISSLDIDDPYDDKITQSMTIKLTGKGTWT
jgi:predicted secreted protein